MPIGALIFLSPAGGRRRGLGQVFVGGVGLGLLLEAGQLLTYSGNVEVISLLTRGLGMTLGFISIRALLDQPGERTLAQMKYLVPLTIGPYFLVLFIGNHWGLNIVADLDGVAQKLSAVSFIPFYYHYYNPEVSALQKILYQSAMYAPAGLLWALTAKGSRSSEQWWQALGIGLSLSLLMFVGRLFLDERNPDPTNIVVACVASVGGFFVGRKLVELLLAGERSSDFAGTPETVNQEPAMTDIGTRVIALGLLVVVGLLVVQFPVQRVALAATLAGYAVLVRRVPGLWLFLLPALMPAGDFATRTGWLIFDAYDLVILTTLIVLLWGPGVRLERPTSGLASVLMGLLATAYALSAISGVFFFENSSEFSLLGFDGGGSVWFGLKGFLLPLMLLPFIARAAQLDAQGCLRRIVAGVVCGLFIASLGVVWERHLFTGLFDFVLMYRASGMMSSMHTGGASLDAYLVISLPFLAFSLLARSPLFKAVSVVILVLATYAILVTFTRTSTVAVIVSYIVLLSGFLLPSTKRRLWLYPGAILTVVALIAWSGVLSGTAVTSRWQHAMSDVSKRFTHWSDVLALRNDSVIRSLIGRGIGSYVGLRLGDSGLTHRPGLAKLIDDNDNTYLRLIGGTYTYVDQRVDVEPRSSYVISLSARSTSDTEFTVSLCEKNLMNSKACVKHRLSVVTGEQWTPVSTTVETGVIGVGRPPFGLKPPVAISIFFRTHGQVIDVDEIRLATEFGENLLTNGDFESGRSFWYFTHDDHIAWHIKNLWLHMLFEQGWFGLIVVTLLGIYLILRLVHRVGQGDQVAVILLSSFSAFVVSGVADSILDVPRSSMLVTWLVMIILLFTPRVRAGRTVFGNHSPQIAAAQT